MDPAPLDAGMINPLKTSRLPIRLSPFISETVRDRPMIAMEHE